jgi:hypothetical protein
VQLQRLVRQQTPSIFLLQRTFHQQDFGTPACLSNLYELRFKKNYNASMGGIIASIFIGVRYLGFCIYSKFFYWGLKQLF